MKGNAAVWISTPGKSKIFLLCTSSRLASWPNNIVIQWASEVLSSAVKRSELQADHSSPTSDEVKNISIYISTPSRVFLPKSLNR
jgi:hypothetical protein